MEKSYRHTCVWCGIQFVNNKVASKTCSDECRIYYKRKKDKEYRKQYREQLIELGIEQKNPNLCSMCNEPLKSPYQKICFWCVVDMLCSDENGTYLHGKALTTNHGYRLKDVIKAVRDGVELW